jgi:serine/threonine protein kinase
MTSIDPSMWRRLSPLLDELLELDAAARAARVAALRSEDATLADNLLVLLDVKNSADEEQFLDADAVATPLPAQAPSLEGTRIGAYVIESFLGQGGSGSVWRARRADERIGGFVAIKLLHLSMLGPAGRLRFEREGAILARLTHPHIARLIDAGVTSAGQPYLALDLVTGQTIDRYCDERRLDVDQRLALFDDVLAAVAHAHSHLIVHRDIKPGNILVDADGAVKLLDFGIARLLEDDTAPVTVEGQRALTPHYAAPEQLQGTPITTATDIYALGVLLYELLVGQHPTSARATSSGDVIRATLEVDPAPLPRALTPSAARPRQAIADAAAARNSTPERLHRKLRGDIENIVARMLRKDPVDRYQTAAALADDLRRYRANQPVSARPDSIAYRLAKFTRRHRSMVAAAAVVALSLAAGLAGTISQARRAEAEAAKARLERDHAMRQLSYAESSNEFITFLLDQGGSDKPVIMAELLARGEQLVTRQFADDPATRARLQMHLSGLHAQSGQSVRAEALLAQAQRAAQPVDDPMLHATLDCALAWQASEKGSSDLALRMVDTALARLAAAADDETAKTARAECLFTRGQVRFASGDARASTADLEQALATLGQPRTDQRTLAIRIRSTLALALHRVGQPSAAIAEYERVLGELEAMGRGSTQLVAALYNNLGVLLNASGQTLRAQRASERALAIGRGAGTTDPVFEAVYAKLLTELGRTREALPLAEHAIASARASGNERVKTIAAQNGAVTLCAVGNLARCAALLDEAQAGVARAMRPGSTAMASVQIQQAELALARADPREAARLLALALAAYGDAAVPNVNAIQARVLLARAAQRLGDLASAQRHADEAIAAARKAMTGFEHSRSLGSALVARGLIQQASGDLEGARASWRAALVELRATAGDTAPPTEEVRRLLAGG